MSPLQCSEIYCSMCRQQAKIVHRVEEAYPGQYVTLFTSECCDAGLQDISGKPFYYGELSHAYENQKSWEIIE